MHLGRTSFTLAAVVALTTGTACLGPNPKLEECGELWVIEADDAWYQLPGDTYYRRVCAQWGYPECIYARGESCLTTEQVSELLQDSESIVAMALRLKAIAACKDVAADKGAIWENCEEGLGAPFYDGRCPLEPAECTSGEESGSTEDESTDGAEPIPDLADRPDVPPWGPGGVRSRR